MMAGRAGRPGPLDESTSENGKNKMNKMERLKWWHIFLTIGILLLVFSYCTPPLLYEENICREYNYDTGECLDEHRTDKPYNLHESE